MAEPLTVNSAVSLLDSISEQPEPVEPVEVPGEETEAQPSAEPEEPEEATPQEEGEETSEVIPRPQSWAADDQAAWDAVPDEVKPVILARETERDRATQKAVQTASEARRAADAEIKAVTDIKAVLDQTLPQIIAMNQSKWSGWTPQAQAEMARTDPARFIALKAEYDAEQGALAQAQRVNQSVQEQAFSAFIREQSARLVELAPELADAKEGASRKSALSSFLVSQGIPEDQISRLDATAISLAYDAMRYRQSRGQLATPKSPAPSRPALKPAAASAVRTPQREVESARNRFHQTGRIEDAVAFLNKRTG